MNFDITDYTVLRQERPGYVLGGGCAIFTHLYLSYRTLDITSSIECGAVEIVLSIYYLSTVNIYHRGLSLVLIHFDSICTQLPSAVLCSDFNAYKELWGSDHLDAERRILDILREASKLVLLNDGSRTCLNSNGSLSYHDII